MPKAPPLIIIPQEVTPLDAKVYEVLALAMRYFFTIIGVMIVWRSFAWLRKDRRLKHRRLRQLPDAGTIGIFTVEQGGKHLKPGDVIPVPHEGVLGYLRTCDVVVPVDDVATAHLDFSFADGKGLYIHPRRGCEAMVDGVPLATRRDSLRHPMQHGSVLEIGQAVLRLGVFAGLDVPEARSAAYDPEMEAPSEAAWTPESPEGWPPYPQQPVYPQQPYQPAPYGQPPYAPPVNQPPYAPPVPPPYGPAMNPPTQPWQGGDGDAQ